MYGLSFRSWQVLSFFLLAACSNNKAEFDNTGSDVLPGLAWLREHINLSMWYDTNPPAKPLAGRLTRGMCENRILPDSLVYDQIDWYTYGEKQGEWLQRYAGRHQNPICWGEGAAADKWFDSMLAGKNCDRPWMVMSEEDVPKSSFQHYTQEAPAVMGLDPLILEFCRNLTHDARPVPHINDPFWKTWKAAGMPAPEKSLGPLSTLESNLLQACGSANRNILRVSAMAQAKTSWDMCANVEWVVCAAKGKLPNQGRTIEFSVPPGNLDGNLAPTYREYRSNIMRWSADYEMDTMAWTYYLNEVCFLSELCDNADELWTLKRGEPWVCKHSRAGEERLKDSLKNAHTGAAHTTAQLRMLSGGHVGGGHVGGGHLPGGHVGGGHLPGGHVGGGHGGGPTQTLSTTATTTSMQRIGDCVGNDSRCAGSSQTKCNSLHQQQVDCQWEWQSNVPGTCSGNDSRCGGSHAAKCIRIASRGADCKWRSAVLTSGSPGTCLGNDSRCMETVGQRQDEQGCKRLENEGADCRWRSAFQVTGSMEMTVSDVDGFMSSASAKRGVTQGISNITSVLPRYIDVDLAAKDRRRLQERHLASGALTVTYVIAVPGDAPVKATGGEVGQKLRAATGGTIQQVIASNVANAVGSGTFVVSGVQSVGQPAVVEADTASFTSTTITSITAIMTTTTTTTTMPAVADGHCNTGTLALPTSPSFAPPFAPTGNNCPTIMNEAQRCAVGCSENYESIGYFTCSSGVLIGESVCMPISPKRKDTSSSISAGIVAIIILLICLFLFALVAIAYSRPKGLLAWVKTRMSTVDSKGLQADFETKYAAQSVQSDLEVGNDMIVARMPSRTLLDSPSCEAGKKPKVSDVAQEAPSCEAGKKPKVSDMVQEAPSTRGSKIMEL